MNLHTTQGDFETFAELRYAFMQQNTAAIPVSTDEWEGTHLHASEVGYCPRATMLRICGAPPKVQANLTKANEALMFAMGYFAHYLTYAAMEWAGILVASEKPLLEYPWSGRCDAIFLPDYEHPEQEMLYDAKTTRPNAFKYSESFPKEPHCLQIGAYGTSVKSTYILSAVIEYIDRGGSNPPVECRIDVPAWAEKARVLMDEREAMYRECVGKEWTDAPLPPMLTESFVPHYRKAPNQDFKNLVSVTYDCSWECSWCQFHNTNPDDSTRPESPCKPPNHEAIEIAKKLPESKGGGWTFTPAASLSGFEEWMSRQAKVVPIIGGDEE